jgi:hypothetical protein
MKKIEMKRIIVYLSTFCNLRCKLCSEYITHIPQKTVYPVEQIKKSFYEYFQIVSHVKTITLTGGEPLLVDSSSDLSEFLLQFSNQYDKLEIMTNGTLMPSPRLTEALARNGKALLFINDYGILSPRADEIVNLCEKHNINYVLRIYHGENAHCGGWYDMELLSGSRLTSVENLTERFKNCITGNSPKLGLSFGLFGNKLFACAMSGIVERLNLLNDKDMYLDLCDDNLSYLQKKKYIEAARARQFLPACAVCGGNDGSDNVKRFIPAEQIN